MIVCTNCGEVDGYEPMKEFCSLHDNRCKIILQYFRKYYLNKVTFNLTKQYDIIITTKSKNKIITVFEKIDNVLPQINGNKKRMININFIAISNDVQINIDYKKTLVPELYIYANGRRHPDNESMLILLDLSSAACFSLLWMPIREGWKQEKKGHHDLNENH